jgi:phosphoenolpyruvate carboxykinase (ATP)
MADFGIKNPNASLSEFGIKNYKNAYWNLSPEELVEHSIKTGQGVLADSGALVIKTGKFTGRSPENRFIVKDNITTKSVDWGKSNLAFEAKDFKKLWNKAIAYCKKKDLYVREARACASNNPDYNLRIRVVNEFPWSNQFASNMFLRPDHKEIESFEPRWLVLNLPGFEADPAKDGTPSKNFAIINFKERKLLIGGTGYTGEIKKGIFSVVNFVLPHKTKTVLPMHCSANLGKSGDIALFFGLSGTGKTTLSADPNRPLIGDDEHAWGNNEVFNFEGGCYAKTIDLTEEKEPDIFRAIRHGAILENVTFIDGTREVNYADKSITENTRVSYPIQHIDNAVIPSRADGNPKNVFFLTCDAYGVLPPISRLTPEQAMYYFISGYTAKVAGTEVGVTEPKRTFSACFGAPFLPLHPTAYANLLGKKLRDGKVNVWMINTGWSGGVYGVGERIKLRYTRAMITAALNGSLDKTTFAQMPVFGLSMPTECPDVPAEILNPRNTWADKAAYDAKCKDLAQSFVDNFSRFADKAGHDIMSAAPKI